MINARFEHLAINVPDMEVAATWYCNQLGMTRVRHDPGVKMFLADRAGVVVLELYANESKPRLDLAATASAALHLAFSVDEIEPAVRELVAAGATVESEPAENAGDMLAMLRDPFGLALQLVQRTKPLL